MTAFAVLVLIVGGIDSKEGQFHQQFTQILITKIGFIYCQFC